MDGLPVAAVPMRHVSCDTFELPALVMDAAASEVPAKTVRSKDAASSALAPMPKPFRKTDEPKVGPP